MRSIFINMLIVAVIIAAFLLYTSIFSVDVGYAAVIVDPFAGKIVDVVWGPAFRLKAPWQDVKILSVAVQTVMLEDKNAVIVVTKDGARIPVQIQVRFQLKRDKDAVVKLVQMYPENPYKRIREEVVERAAYEVVRTVIGQYNLVEIVPKVREISAKIEHMLMEKLKNDPSIRGVIKILDISVKSIDIPKELTAAIVAKLKAQQEAEAARYQAQKEIVMAEMEAKKRIIAANATAMQQVIAARAEAEKRIIEANATAQKIVIEAKAMARSIVEKYLGEAKAIVEIAKKMNITPSEAAEIYYKLKLLEMIENTLPAALNNATITLIMVPQYNTTIPLVPIILPQKLAQK